jgi:hypothetical protein
MKRPFSRFMPPAPENKPSILAWCLLIVIFSVGWPLMLIGLLVGKRHLRRLASERTGEHIGTFARGFDRRSEPFDPWVVRATWDALKVYVVFDGTSLPLRPTDRLLKDLCIDPDDIDCLLPEVAVRSGHSMDCWDSNPYAGKVETVADFVRFIMLQPLAAVA